MKKTHALLPRGKHLFLKFKGKSRTGMSISATVLVRDPDAQPGQQMVNVSRYAAETLGKLWHTTRDEMIMQDVPPRPAELGKWIAEELGKNIHHDPNAFTWEWL